MSRVARPGAHRVRASDAPPPALPDPRGGDPADLDARLPSGPLERGLGILSILGAATGPRTLSRIAEDAGCDPSTALRVLRVLVRAEFAIHDADARVYLPAPRALSPLSLYHPINTFRRDALAFVSRLREDTGLTVALVVFLRLERMVLDIVHGAERMSPYYETHLKRPVHTSATGKVLLSDLDGSHWPRLLGDEPFAAFTGRSRTTAAELRQDIERGRADGYFATVDESLVGLSALAAPIRSRTRGVVGCLAAFGQTGGLAAPRHHPRLGTRVREVADLISQASSALQELSSLVGLPPSPQGSRSRRA